MTSTSKRPTARILVLLVMVLPALVVPAGAAWAIADLFSEPGHVGIVGHRAPEIAANVWYNLADDEDAFRLAGQEGKVVYLFFFQSWCPGCHSHGFPTLQDVHAKYGDRRDIVFVALQTTFEGFSSNDSSAALETVEGFDLNIPTGHDEGFEGEGSITMRRYRSGGTPWTVLIDREGKVRWNGFRISPQRAISAVGALLAEGKGKG